MDKQGDHMAEEGAGAHCCEICGLSGLTDDKMRAHTVSCHVEGRAACPFCGMWGVSASELLLHVNQVHLDYLTPENETMSFIDDQSPSIDEDSDTLSECRGTSPSLHDSWSQQNNTKSNINQYASLNGLSSCNSHERRNYSLEAHRSNSESGNIKSNHRSTQSVNEVLINGKHKYNSSSTNINVNHRSSSETNKFTNTNNHSKSNGVIHKDTSRSPKVNVNNTPSKSTNINLKSADMNGTSNGKDDKGYCNGTKSKLSKISTEKREYSSSDESQGKNHVNGSAGQGSPLRSQLGLKLKTHHNTQNSHQCPLCPHTSESASSLEEHVNRVHFDPTSPSVLPNVSISNQASSNGTTMLQCPLCNRGFGTGPDLELHVNIEHRDILSPETNPLAPANPAPTVLLESSNQPDSDDCPMCGMSLTDVPQDEINRHIESHFPKSPQGAQAAPEIDKEVRKMQEQREFQMLRAQYGMDDHGNFREQSSAAMQRAVYAGEMSVADYYERQVGLRAAESHGIDDGSSCTKGIASKVKSLSAVSPRVQRTLICSAADHYASSYGDRGWGCGYRNLQMLLSSLLQNTAYNEALYSAWGGSGPPRTAVPSISRLQRMVEAAWAQGFDIQGSEQLGCKLHNTRKWIGATEVVTLLSWLRIKCQLIDFHTTTDGGHPELFQWVLSYFENAQDFVPPLYLQHQGHSRTIIGIEQRRGGGLTLLVLDPSHGPSQISALLNGGHSGAQAALRLLRRGPAAMRARQYQLVAIKGFIDTEEQYERSKVLHSIRVPQDR